MKANWDDRIAPSKRERNLGWVIAIFFACGVTFLGLKWLSNTVITVSGKPQSKEEPYQYKYDYDSVERDSAPAAEEQFWSDVKKNNEERRQTEFNDKNYAPKNPINVVSTQGVRESSAYKAIKEERLTVTERTVHHDQVWVRKWSGGGSYLASWTAINNQIDGRTVCANHKAGSVDYRECRKGAKQYFHDQCKSDRNNAMMKQRYCSAASRFSPIM